MKIASIYDLNFDLPILSYSTIEMLHKSSHQWVNKTNKIKRDPNAGNYTKPDGTIGNYFTEGRVGHNLIQKHISKQEPSPLVVFDKEVKEEPYFPLVEEVDFDKRTGFMLMFGEYQVIGYADGLNGEAKTGAEIKLSSTPWTLKKYFDSDQRKMYGLGFPWLQKMYLITGLRYPEKWKETPLKVHCLPFEEKDKERAIKFIEEGIQVIEDGDYTGGLDDNGRCRDRNCAYGPNCIFK